MIAKTFSGLEEVLARELVELGAGNVQTQHRAVSFTGDRAMMYKANLHCRTASRILKPILTFKASDADRVYEILKEVRWENYLHPHGTFAVDATVYSDHFRHSKYVTYRVKDAIADYFTERYDRRPTVSVARPQLMFNIHIAQQQCTLSLDSSGESLHKRGYRTDPTEAPLNEALAAGMLLMAGWRGQSDFVDPMCGSGTLLIEAALIALNIPPGIYRKEFAFERWRDFDKELFDTLYNDDTHEREFTHTIYGSDISLQAIRKAKENLQSAGLTRYVKLKVAPLQQAEAPPGKCLLVTNPPYGERMSPDNLFQLYSDLGRLLKHHFVGSTAWVISSNEESLTHIGLRPSAKIKLLNGALECQYCRYDIFEGKRNDYLKKKEKEYKRTAPDKWNRERRTK